MRMRLCLAAFMFVSTLALSSSLSLFAQESTFLIPVEMKGQVVRGSAAVSLHGNDGTIGINGKGTETGYKVELVSRKSCSDCGDSARGHNRFV